MGTYYVFSWNTRVDLHESLFKMTCSLLTLALASAPQFTFCLRKAPLASYPLKAPFV